MGTYVQQVPIKFLSLPVVAGTPVYLDVQGFPFPISVTTLPGSGGTMTVYFSTTPGAAGKLESAIWQEWPLGAQTGPKTDGVISPVAGLKFTATTVNGVAEVSA